MIAAQQVAKIAAGVRACLDQYGKPHYPGRPAALVQQEDLEEIRRRRTPTAQERQQLRLFGVWRQSWLHAETQAVANLTLLLRTISGLDYHGLEASDLRAFVAREYGQAPRRPLRAGRVRACAEALGIDTRGFPESWRKF